MKARNLMTSILFTIFILLAPAIAQIGAIRVSIPFDFNVGKQTVSAGDYKVAINGSLLEISRIGGPVVAYVTTNLTGGGPNDDRTPRLIFHRYGTRSKDTRFLSIVWIGESSQAHELYVSPMEVEFARTMKQEQQVILASNKKK